MSASKIFNMQAGDAAEREIVITRLINAPREMVWDALTDPVKVAQWWGPRGFTTTIHEMDFRPGGHWKHTMHGPDGVDYPNHSVFLEIVKPERIVWSHGGHREGGPGARFDATWTFEEKGEQTLITMRSVFLSRKDRDFVIQEFGAVEGGKQTLERLSEFVEKRPVLNTESTGHDLTFTRAFKASREDVFRAWTDPAQVAQWWGPNGFTTPRCELDARPGGTMTIDMRGPDGQIYPMNGTFREVRAPEKLVFVSGPVNQAGEKVLETLTTVTFTAQGNKTTVTVQVQILNQKPEAAPMLAGMEQGWSETLDRMAKFAEKA